MKGIATAPSMGAFLMELMHARTNAHVLHLTTKSFAKHVALNEFYDGIVERLDSIAETYQGRYGIIDYPAVPFRAEKDPIMMIRSLRRYVDETREALCDHSEIQNLIDEAVALMDSTLYKLENLT
jgi:hypothetical protein